MTAVDTIAKLTRNVRFPGRYKFLRHFFPPEKFRQDGAQDRWFVNYDGNLKILCNLGSFIEWSIFFKGYYDPDLSSIIKKLTRPGMVVLDVGANVGAYTLLVAKQIGINGKVIAFEPNPEVYERLLRNVTVNGFQDRVTLCPLALSQAQGKATLHIPQKDYHHRGIGSLYQYAGALTEQIEVSVSTIDEEVGRRRVDKLGLIKVDTEGNDVLVLEGAINTISHHKPLIIFEANYLAHQRAGTNIETIHEMLKSLGYSFFAVGLLGSLRRLNHDSYLPDTNIVCMPRAK